MTSDHAARLRRGEQPSRVRAELRPQPLRLAGSDPVAFLNTLTPTVSTTWTARKLAWLDGRNGRLDRTAPGRPAPRMDFVSAGRGDIQREDIFRMLKEIGYDAFPFSSSGRMPQMAYCAEPRRQSPSCDSSTSSYRKHPRSAGSDSQDSGPGLPREQTLSPASAPPELTRATARRARGQHRAAATILGHSAALFVRPSHCGDSADGTHMAQAQACRSVLRCARGARSSLPCTWAFFHCGGARR